MEFFRNLFSLDGFPPRWFCGTWPESLGYLHIASDLTIFLAYTAIPITLVYFIMRRNDIPFPPIFWLFSCFVLLCGLTHLVEVSMFWFPWYRFSGLMKVLTAVVSVATAIALIRLVPEVLKIPAATKRLKTFINSTPFAVAVVNKKRRIEFSNRQLHSLFESPHDSIADESIFSFIDKGSWEKLEKLFETLWENSAEKIELEVEGVANDGHLIPLLITANRIKDPNQTSLIMLALTDLSPQKALEIKNKKYMEKLEESNIELEDFSRVVSHDLKEPIRGIKNYAYMILEDGKLDGDSKEMLGSISKLSDRLHHMITDLLSYSVLGKTKEDVVDVNLCETFESVQETLSPLVKSKNVALTFPKTCPIVRFDGVRLSQIFYNLITNAIKYNNAKNIKVDVSYAIDEEDNMCTFCVKDNGVGIRECNLNNVFIIFKRLNGKEKYGEGAGVGLTIIKKMIEMNGGKIWVDSVYGEGSSFYFTVPLANQKADGETIKSMS